jgi:hypothetical protein
MASPAAYINAQATTSTALSFWPKLNGGRPACHVGLEKKLAVCDMPSWQMLIGPWGA